MLHLTWLQNRRGHHAHDPITVLIAMLLTSLSAFAQPLPTLTSISPDVLEKGQSATLTLTGENIAHTTRILVIGPPGITATLPTPTTKPAKSIALKMTASADAARGLREIRLVTPDGVTKPVFLSVDDLPPVAEKEPNNSPGQAQAITLPAVITGRIQADLDIDCFKFSAKKGQRLIFDVQAYRTGSRLDGSLILFDGEGHRVAHDEDTNGLDPFIDYLVPADGQYTLHLQDLQFKGGGDYAFKIRAGEIPYVDAIFPLGGQRGQQVAVQLKGRNLAGMKWMSMSLDTADTGVTREIEAPTPAGLSNALPFAVSDLPETREDPAAKINTVLPPIVVNGRIGKAGETDTYQFKAAAAGPLVLEIAAARLGSRLDALLTLMDDHGAVLQRNDDAPANTDARLQFNAEKDKVYQVSVRDLTDHGGDNYAYRLSIAPPRAVKPDFEIMLKITDPLRLNRGGRTMLWAGVNRIGGFKGDVTVSLWPLPPGVTCRPLRVSATQPSSGIFTLAADSDAPLGFHPLNIIATGQVGEETISKSLQLDPILKSIPEAYLTVHGPAPFSIARIGPPPAADPKARAARIAALEKTLNTQTPELDAAETKWEKSFNLASAWEVVDVISANASSSIKLVKQPDGSLLAQGRVPTVDKYTIVAKVSQPNIRAIRLEAIADGGKGPGRAENGNYVLSRFTVAQLLPNSTDAAAGQPLEIASATADFNQNGFDVAQSLHGPANTGWAISPELGKSHTAIYTLKSPALTKAPGTLAFTLDHASTYPQHILGHFRLLVTASEKPDDTTKIPAALLAILKTPAGSRTGAQQNTLAAFYRTLAPELAPARQELAALKTSGAPFPPTIKAGASAKLDVLVTRNPDFKGDITLTLEGFSSGLDEKTKAPAPFTKNFDFTPITLKANQSSLAVDLRPRGNSEKGTRDAILRAQAMVNGATYITFSPPFPITIK
jgi:hypothetical protein